MENIHRVIFPAVRGPSEPPPNSTGHHSSLVFYPASHMSSVTFSAFSHLPMFDHLKVIFLFNENLLVFLANAKDSQSIHGSTKFLRSVSQ